jgi:hypothetical protein
MRLSSYQLPSPSSQLRFWLLSGLLLLGLEARDLRAEGTAQLMPAGASGSCISYLQGNDGTGKEGPTFGRPWYDLIYVHISDPSTEVIYYGWTRRLPGSQPVYYRIIDPDGNMLRAGRVAETAADSGYIADDGVEAYAGPKHIAGSTGYDALVCTPTVAGDYAIMFNVGNDSVPTTGPKYYLHPFDVTVGDISGPGQPDAIAGRLFSYKWHLNTNSFSHEACMQFYTWTPDSLVIQMDMNQIRPYGFTVSFNSHGAAHTGDIEADRRSSASVSEAVPEYRVFLNEPDSLAYPTGTPGRITYLDIEGCHADSSFCIEVNATKLGEINVYIDLNGNGVYEEGTVDRYFPFNNTRVGPICVPWDGLDGLGDPVGPGSRGTVTVAFLAGEVHYPVFDPENHPYGFSCTMIRPSGFTPLMYFDNRDTPIGTYELNGCSDSCNTWSSNLGNNIMVNTWLNTITSTDTDSFYVTDVCPPEARDDSTCTIREASLSYSLLDNDEPGDYALDHSSVILKELSDSLSAVSYLASDRLLQFIPSESGPDQVRVTYEVCDSTPARLHGPLCDEAQVVIDLYDECAEARVMPHLPWELKAQRYHQDVILQWHREDDAIQQYLIERAECASGPFEPLGVLMPGHARHRYVDKGVVATGWEQAVYRVKALGIAGAVQTSPAVQVALPGEESASVHAQVNARDQQLAIRYVSTTPLYLHIVDGSGREVARLELPPQRLPHLHQVSTSHWGPGWYLMAIYQQDWRVYAMPLRVD